VTLIGIQHHVGCGEKNQIKNLTVRRQKRFLLRGARINSGGSAQAMSGSGLLLVELVVSALAARIVAGRRQVPDRIAVMNGNAVAAVLAGLDPIAA